MEIHGDKKQNEKFKCNKCSVEFVSEQKLMDHQKDHASGIYCESCPIDMAISKLVKLLRRTR